MYYVITALLAIIAFELFKVYKALEKCNIKEEKPPETPQYVMTDEDLQKFLKADQDSAQDFYSTLATLNAFMTDSEEDYTDVGKQEI